VLHAVGPGVFGREGAPVVGLVVVPAAFLKVVPVGKFGLPSMPLTFRPGDVIWADSTAGFATGAQLLYQAIGASNLAAFRDGTDNVGHAALST
jgi:hypothetical protein